MIRNHCQICHSTSLSAFFAFLLVVAFSQTTSFATCVADEETKSKKPNILFIFSDDHAPHAIGAYNGWLKSVDPTPNIDNLARQGMLFQNSFCTNSICGPSRAVIITGKHSHKNGFMNNGNNFDGSQQTFPKLMQKAGYQTAMIGKWHLKSDPQGFNYWDILLGQGQYYNPIMKSVSGKRTIEGHCTQVVTDLAVDWLKKDRDPDKPFVLMCQHKAPHRCWMPSAKNLNLYDDIDIPEPDTLFDKLTDNARAVRNQEMEIDRHMDIAYDLFADPPADWPYTENPLKHAPREEGPNYHRNGRDISGYRNFERMTPEQMETWNNAFKDENAALTAANLTGEDLVRWKFQRYAKNYLRCVRGVDDSVGELMQYLKDSGLEENTIVVYSSDQGFYIGDHGWFDKRWMYEESLKMPLIIKWPGQTKPGSVNENLVQNLDYAETFLEMVGAEIPDDMQGRSLVPLLKGETVDDWRKTIYYHFYEYPSVHMCPKHNGVRNERYKLIQIYEFGQWEFYDLETDPDEKQNLYEDPEYQDEIATMKAELERLRTLYEDDTVTPAKSEQWRESYQPAQ
jgi:arylsulfatase A-like enzyme